MLPQSEEKVRLFQRKLYKKSKREEDFRFYSLHDKIYREDVLQYAWQRCRANDGAPGVDGLDFQTIEEEIGVDIFLQGIAEELKSNTYSSQPVRRVYIPKADGSQRPLGIPTIKDRVIQMACLIIIEPIFEADFLNCSYGFRPKRNAHQAIKDIKSHIQQGFKAVYDADLRKCFDTIPHNVIMDAIDERISDKGVLRLINKWLTTPVVEPGGPSCGRKSSIGTPQGGPISPLLANIVLNKLDKAWHRPGGPRERYNARLVRYADDSVILARFIGEPIVEEVRQIISALGLEINEQKTKVVELKQGDVLEFLGYAIRLSKRNKRITLKPGKKAYRKLRGRINEIVSRANLYKGLEGIITELNLVLRGWKKYFRMTTVNRVFWSLDFYITARFYRVGRALSQRLSKTFKPGVFKVLRKMGLYSLALD